MNNILDKTDQSMAPTCGGVKNSAPVKKRDKFSWATGSDPGEFRWIDKHDLNIDGDYQRDATSRAKVLNIARNWDWKLVGALSVIERRDGSLWIFDGGHRVRAAFSRDDVTILPCMVFKCMGIEDEAKAFVGANTITSSVSAHHKYKAALVAREPNAIAVQAVLEKHGYRATNDGTTKHGFRSIGALSRMVRINAEQADRTIGLCAEMAENGEQPSGKVAKGLFSCESKLSNGSIFAPENEKKLCAIGLRGVSASISREIHIIGRGGTAVSARAILDLLNKSRRRNKLSFS